MDLWLLQAHSTLFHNFVARGKSTLDFMANNQNPYGENEWGFYFRIHSVALL